MWLALLGMKSFLTKWAVLLRQWPVQQPAGHQASIHAATCSSATAPCTSRSSRTRAASSSASRREARAESRPTEAATSSWPQANQRIQKFTNAGVFVAKWGSSGSGLGQFASPIGIAVEGTGYVYVADTGNDRLQKLTSGGTFVTQWGSSGSGVGQFSAPGAVAADASGNVFVVDPGNSRIQKFACP
jgi:hypothetical protein